MTECLPQTQLLVVQLQFLLSWHAFCGSLIEAVNPCPQRLQFFGVFVVYIVWSKCVYEQCDGRKDEERIHLLSNGESRKVSHSLPEQTVRLQWLDKGSRESRSIDAAIGQIEQVTLNIRQARMPPNALGHSVHGVDR